MVNENYAIPDFEKAGRDWLNNTAPYAPRMVL